MKKQGLSGHFGFNPWGIQTKIFDVQYKQNDIENIIGIDCGGTKTLITHIDASVTGRPGRTCIGLGEIKKQQYFENDKYDSIRSIIQTYLDRNRVDPTCTCASIAAAGPLIGQTINMSNRLWAVNSDEIQNQFQFKQVYLLNDLQAMIYAVDNIEPKHIITLNEGKKNKHGNVAVIAAGTGLGESIGLYLPQQEYYHAVATEGGGADFAPGNKVERSLLKHLQSKKEHVSWEDIVSGKGILNIYEFLIENSTADSRLKIKDGKKISAEIILTQALSGKDMLCKKTLEIFLSAYAAEAGNLALKCLPYGGLYITGGIAASLVTTLQDENILQRFFNKGVLKSVMEDIPVYLVTHPEYVTIGAINYALLELHNL